jgi:serine/threonine protein kinase
MEVTKPAALPVGHKLYKNKDFKKEQYEITQLVGEGAFGYVYLVKDLLFENKRYAIKQLIKSDLVKEIVPWPTLGFITEASILSKLSHPHLPAVYKYFVEESLETDQNKFMVMEYIDGLNLFEYMIVRNVMAGGPFLSVLEAVRIAKQISDVMAYLHDRKHPIIFRDLKPNNIMVIPDEKGYSKAYLIDFSLHRIYKENKGHDTLYAGNEYFVPPEVLEKKAQSGPAADIYSFGVTMYIILTGDTEFVPRKIPPLNLHGQVAPAGLQTLITTMTQIDPNKRPQSMYHIKRGFEKIERQLLLLYYQRVQSEVCMVE